MSDFIRREDLVKELNAQFAVGDITREIANDILNHIPSAEPERTANVEKVTRVSSVIRTGRCENCGYDVIDSYKHCPGCGSKLDWSE